MMNQAQLLEAPSAAVPQSMIDLEKGALWTRRLRGQPLQLRCTSGAVWITREGGLDDVVLQAGSSYGEVGRGLVVAEALENAEISVSTDDTFAAIRAAARAASEHWRILLSLVVVYLVWGSTYLGIAVGLETIPPFLMGGIRFLVAGSLLYGALRLRGVPHPTRREWGAALWVGILLLTCGNGFIVISQQWVTSGVSAVVVSTMPLWVAVFTSVNERTARRNGRATAANNQVSAGEWVGLIVGFAGAALLHLGGDLHAAHAGALFLVLAPVCWALGSVQSRWLPLPQGPMAVAAEMLCGGIIMLALSFLLGEHLLAMPSSRSVAALVYLIVFGSIAGMIAYTYLLRNTRPAIATSYAYVNPLVAIALGVLIGGEHASAMTWVSSGVIGLGVLLLSRAQARSRAAARP